ncbi:MAG: asparaginase domain-containing protein [Pseudomonadota bacterium]
MTKRFLCGGAIDPQRQVYVTRQADQDVLNLLLQGNSVNLHAGRQTGKTSLMYRTRDALQQQGHLCVTLDLTQLFQQGSLADGLARLMDALSASLSFRFSPLPSHSPADTITNCTTQLCQQLAQIPEAPQRLYLFWDEVDVLMRLPAHQVTQFFLALRHFFNTPSTERDRLVLSLTSVLTPNEMIFGHDTGGIGINFLRDVPLAAFSPEVCTQLSEQGFAETEQDQITPVLHQVLELTGGQPFLTALLCQDLQTNGTDDPASRFAILRKEVLHAPRSIAHGHLLGMRKQLMDMGDRLFSLLQCYQRILRDEALTASRGGWDAISLENIGLIRLHATGQYALANPIYQAHFDLAWAEELQTARETASLAKSSLQATGDLLFDRQIALILCGGTIGMVTHDGKSGFQGAQDVLTEFIQQQVSRIARVQAHPLYQLDGINMGPAQWLGIARFIDEWWDHYDGFVIAHGTDTLAMTASAVSMMLGRVNKPVVFTGAQTTLDVLHGDATSNLLRAVYVAAHLEGVCETQICFNDQVLRAVRAEKSDDRMFAGFISPAWPALAHITENLLINPQAQLASIATRADFQPYLAEHMLFIPLIPGMRPDDYQALLTLRQQQGRAFQGIIISTPGLGNIPSEPPYNFRTFIQSAVQAHIPVLISSQVPINPYTQNQYEAASVPAQYGAIPAGNLTLAAAFTKFAWVIGQVTHNWSQPDKDQDFLDQVKTRMRVNYVGEEGDYVSIAHAASD